MRPSKIWSPARVKKTDIRRTFFFRFRGSFAKKISLEINFSTSRRAKSLSGAPQIAECKKIHGPTAFERTAFHRFVPSITAGQ
jgi:hypothetical protein